MLNITTCPTCGSRKIKRVRRNMTREFQGITYTVPDLEFHECPVCGERLYDPEAARKIEAYSPAYDKTRARKHSPIAHRRKSGQAVTARALK